MECFSIASLSWSNSVQGIWLVCPFRKNSVEEIDILKKRVLYDFQTYIGTIIPVYCLMLVFWQNILSSWSNVLESTTNSLQKTTFAWTANFLPFFDASLMEIYWASLHLKQPLVVICSVLPTTLFSPLLSQIWPPWLTVFQRSSKHYILL